MSNGPTCRAVIIFDQSATKACGGPVELYAFSKSAFLYFTGISMRSVCNETKLSIVVCRMCRMHHETLHAAHDSVSIPLQLSISTDLVTNSKREL